MNGGRNGTDYDSHQSPFPPSRLQRARSVGAFPVITYGRTQGSTRQDEPNKPHASARAAAGPAPPNDPSIIQPAKLPQHETRRAETRENRLDQIGADESRQKHPPRANKLSKADSQKNKRARE